MNTPADDEVEVLIIGPSRSGAGGVNRYITGQCRYLPERIRTRVYSVAVPPGTGLARFALAVLIALKQMLLFPFRRPPDVVHIHSAQWNSFYQSSWYVLFVALVWRCPVVLHVHGSSFDEFLEVDSLPVRSLQSVVFDASDVVVALSDSWAEVLESHVDPRKVVVLHNAVDVSEYDPSFSTSPVRMSYVSRHIERKGTRELVEAIDQLAEEVPIDITIASQGPLSHLVEDLADSRSGVEYVGYVSEERKRKILDESMVYVLPTYAEGVPIAILEAMAGGNAIVSTGVGGIPSVVDEDNGVLVEPGDADELADALRTLLADPDRIRAMARASRRRVEAAHSWETVTADLVELYDSLAPSSRETADAPPEESYASK
ncbi:glycosyltransferase family 4 protein [Halorubrum depositum]|uniref:glycosyltransferase family 4 protein n=1 Tax=Halorubrum depositum TaxID=2583992 RepID=UPI00119FE49F|nr:glycosyltransferase family 4 protein [Halorubrum depositum]